jgi:hypothetical protein
MIIKEITCNKLLKNNSLLNIYKHQGMNRPIHMYTKLNVQYNIHIAYNFTSKLIICIQIIK